MTENYYIGTDLKFAITLTCDGFSMDEDDYSILLKCRNRQVTVSKEDIVVDEQDNHYLCVDSSQFGPGILQMVVTAEVPDMDFDDHSRREIARLDLCELENPARS